MSASSSTSEKAGPVLSILIVNFNSTRLLGECLDALAQSTIADRLETIVVDNASSGFDEYAMKRAYPGVRWLPQSANTTYTGGNNIAFDHSRAELILMLNPDTRVEPEALERAVMHMQASRGIVGLGAYLVGPDGKLQRYYRRLPQFEDLPVMLFERLLKNTQRGRRYLMLDETFESPTEVPQPPGAFLLFRRSVVGARLLDAEYFNFMSDLELCDRLNRAGPLIVFPDVRCHHLRGGAGVGTADSVSRLRLYQDLTWGVRRYFFARVGMGRRAVLNAMLIPYWIIRVVRLAITRPTELPSAVGMAASALSGRPPRY